MARLNKVQMKPAAILIDSREHLPYASQIGTVLTGDYSIIELEQGTGAEKKELIDLITYRSTARERFNRELYKGEPHSEATAQIRHGSTKESKQTGTN